jgi:hypothetical protein
MLLDRTNHNRLAQQLAERVATATAIPAADRIVTSSDNAPPKTSLDHARDAYAELAEFLKENPVIQTADQAKLAAGLRERTKIAIDAAREERDTKTRPFLDKLAAIRSLFELVKDKGTFETAYAQLRRRLTDYASAIEAKRAAEAERLRQEAATKEAAAREAEAREQETITNAEQGECSDVAGAIEQADVAFSEFKVANRQAAIAARNVPVRFQSFVGGRSQSMRTVEVLVIDDVAKAIKVMGLTDKIRDAILSSARDFRKNFDELPDGVRSTWERQL